MSDSDYVWEMLNLLDALIGDKRAMPVWNVTDRTVRDWLKGSVNQAERDGVTLKWRSPVYVTTQFCDAAALWPHTTEGAAVTNGT